MDVEAAHLLKHVKMQMDGASTLVYRLFCSLILALIWRWSGTAVVSTSHQDGDRVSAFKSSHQILAPKVAVIGAGVGGASTAHYLRQLFGDYGIAIDVYEATDRVGGRLAVTTIDGHQYETGGSIIHPRNQYMVEFAKLLGLEAKESTLDRVGIFDGHEYVYVESDWDVINYAKLLWRYGPCVLRLQSFVDDMLNDFSNIYARQHKGDSFETVDDLLMAMNPLYVNLTRITARSYLRSRDFSELFIDEMFTAVTRVNYGQSAELNAFVGAVSLAGIQSGLWAIKGGNYQVPKRLLEAAEVRLIHSKVKMILLRDDGRYEVVHGESNTDVEIYDMVFVCTPLTADLSEIEFSGFPTEMTFDGKYQRMVATHVRGTVNATTLQMTNGAAEGITEVLTTSEVYFNSLGLNYPVEIDDHIVGNVWKTFSPQPLTDTEFESLYEQRAVTRVTDWLAYPHYDVLAEPSNHGQFVLHSRLYYTNCIEWAASAMEMSAIAGRNVANLAYRQWILLSVSSQSEMHDQCDDGEAAQPSREEL